MYSVPMRSSWLGCRARHTSGAERDANHVRSAIMVSQCRGFARPLIISRLNIGNR